MNEFQKQVSKQEGKEKKVQKQALGKIAKMLERNGIDIDEVGTVSRISLYQTVTKNEEGEAEHHDLYGIQINPAWQDGPQWDVINQSSPIKLVPSKATRKRSEWDTAVILPDIQMGYFRGTNGALEPTHDESAINVALAIVKDVKPKQIVMVGDNLDLPNFGRYRQSPAFAQTTQASIDRATMLCAQLRSLVPDAEIIWIAGNHEERLPNYIMDNATAAFGLRQGNKPDSFPVLSVPFLCRFDDYNIKYLAGYPTGTHWITERLRVIHGNKVASNGSTAHKYLASEKTSVIYGHIHRREWAERTREDYDGPKTVLAASPGCLSRIDGAVPSTKGSVDLDGRPLTVVEDWQQGVAVIPYHQKTGQFVYEQVAIRDGWAMWRGKEYDGSSV